METTILEYEPKVKEQLKKLLGEASVMGSEQLIDWITDFFDKQKPRVILGRNLIVAILWSLEEDGVLNYSEKGDWTLAAPSS